MLEQRLEQDIKTAMLAHEGTTVTTLRGLKSVLLNAKVAAGTRDSAMDDEQVVALFSKEAKKRQESADLYVQGGNQERADAELAEKALIELYLPAQLNDTELKEIIGSTITELGASDMKNMGQVIAAVKSKTAGAADGAVIARLVKEALV